MNTSSASGCGCVFCILPLVEITSTPVAATFSPASWFTNFSFINPLQFQGVIFSRLETSQWKSAHNAGAFLCLDCIFLAFFPILSVTWYFELCNLSLAWWCVEPPLFFWIWPVIGCCGVSCCSIVSSLSLYWSALSGSEWCSLHILIPPSMSVSKIIIFQGIEKKQPHAFTFQ